MERNTPVTTPPTTPTRWRISSLLLICLPWLVLQFGGLFSPGLLDDVDSIYIQIAREMLQRHDYVTPTIDGIRFFDKPPLMYWMAAGSMKIFGVHDWAARLPLALGVLALLISVYALGIYLFSDRPGGPLMRGSIAHECGSTQSDRAGLYAALAMATSLGPYLYTRFYIPDILIALWMTLSVHLFLIALERVATDRVPQGFSLGSHRAAEKEGALAPEGLRTANSPLLPMLGFAAVMALDVLTKGLIGMVFPLAFVFLYLALTRRLRLLAKLHLVPATLLFLLLAAPWHILAALRNPAIAMPAGLGLPARAGWAWFYLYNEHIARFLGRRIPHDYGQTPIWLFWLLLLIWLLPWVAFLPAAVINAVRVLRGGRPNSTSVISTEGAHLRRSGETPGFRSPGAPSMSSPSAHGWGSHDPRTAALALLLWPAIILGFFTLSSRQEYYHLPALALLVGGLLAAADRREPGALTQASRGALYFLVPLGSLIFIVCAWFAFTAPVPRPGATLTDLLTSNPANYNLSLGHLFDLTGAAMGFFRGPLLTVALGMLTLGPIAYLVRRRRHTFAANLLIAAAMTAVLLGAHEGLARFYPILGSKDLALAIQADSRSAPAAPVLIDGELTAGSSLLFYLDNPVLLVNGRINGPWFGSFWPDARPIFLDDAGLLREWHAPGPLYLLTYHPDQRVPELCKAGPVIRIAASGGKTVLRNHLASPSEPATLPGADLCRQESSDAH